MQRLSWQRSPVLPSGQVSSMKVVVVVGEVLDEDSVRSVVVQARGAVGTRASPWGLEPSKEVTSCGEGEVVLVEMRHRL